MINKCFFILVICIFLLCSCSGTETTQPPISTLTTSPTLSPTETPIPIPTETPTPKLKVCLVVEKGSLEDNGFNEGTWRGIQNSISIGLIDGVLVENQSEGDYVTSINSSIDQNCSLVVGVGSVAAEPIESAGSTNPEINFLIVSGTVTQVMPNVTEISFQLDQAAFLAGYLSAGIAVMETAEGQPPRIATYGAMPFPAIDQMMDKFARGAIYYNTVKGTNVEVLGWDTNDPTKGTYVNSFGDQELGKSIANDFMDQGARVIFPVAGVVGIGSAAAILERGGTYFIGPDFDWYENQPEYSSIILTSVISHLDNVVETAIEELVSGTLAGGEL